MNLHATEEIADETAVALGVEVSGPVAKHSPGAALRVASVDVLRGLTILLMVFVNDLGSAAPSWMHHIRPPNADGMTLADIVFPWFLFIVGVSIPLALERAAAAGTTLMAKLGHIATRTETLLMMALIEINSWSEPQLAE